MTAGGGEKETTLRWISLPFNRHLLEVRVRGCLRLTLSPNLSPANYLSVP